MALTMGREQTIFDILKYFVGYSVKFLSNLKIGRCFSSLCEVASGDTGSGS